MVDSTYFASRTSVGFWFWAYCNSSMEAIELIWTRLRSFLQSELFSPIVDRFIKTYVNGGSSVLPTHCMAWLKGSIFALSSVVFLRQVKNNLNFQQNILTLDWVCMFCRASNSHLGYVPLGSVSSSDFIDPSCLPSGLSRNFFKNLLIYYSHFVCTRDQSGTKKYKRDTKRVSSELNKT